MGQRKPVIAFVINSIGEGGAERALSTILSARARRNFYDVHLILLDDLPDARLMPDTVTRHVLDGRQGFVRSLAALTLTLRRIRPALTVSFLVRANVCNAIASRLSGGAAIVCERMHLGSHLDGRYRGARRAVARLLPRISYGLADGILGVSAGVSRNLVEEFGAAESKVATINNPYDLESIRREGRQAPDIALPDQFILAVGRLAPSKNFHQLIQSYLASSLQVPLLILGEGPQRAGLERLIADAGAADRVRLLGFTARPFPVMARAMFTVSASLNEGFPNAMVEAMALGTPVVSSDCRSGPSEILADRERGPVSGIVQAEYGILVPEAQPALLAAAMELMARPEIRQHYSAQALRRSQDFHVDAIAEQYWACFDRIAQGRAVASSRVRTRTRRAAAAPPTGPGGGDG